MRMMMGVLAMGMMASAAVAQSANPVVESSKEIVTRQAGYMVAAAEEMPEAKYSYKPTADQWTYGKIVAHVVQSNFGICGMFSGTERGQAPAVTETTPKAELVTQLKASFDACGKAIDGLTDAKLSEQISFFGGAKRPRARALIEIVGDLEDHYSQMASYLRLNGLVPPSAQKKPM